MNYDLILFILRFRKNNYNNSNNIITDIGFESDSDFSEISLEPLKIYSDESIKYIFKENQKSILNEENFNKKISKNLKEIYQLRDLNNISK